MSLLFVDVVVGDVIVVSFCSKNTTEAQRASKNTRFAKDTFIFKVRCSCSYYKERNTGAKRLVPFLFLLSFLH